MNTKGFVSLEYILVFAGVLSILTILSTGIISLYNRNISEIDNQRLKENCKDLSLTIELFELMPEGLKEIELNNLFEWTIEIKSQKEIIIRNKQKSCLLASRINIVSTTTLPKKHTLLISKKNNNLNIS